MSIYVFLYGPLICLVIAFTLINKKSSMIMKSDSDNSDNFWAKERTANNTRKKEPINLDYIPFDIKNLPQIKSENPKINRYLSTLERLSGEKIIHFANLSNTDLKLQYGYNNLSHFSDCEDRYLRLIQTLNLLGIELQSNSLFSEAKSVLECAIECGSDISTTYITLAKLYYSENNLVAINQLREKVEGMETPFKEKILNELNKYSTEDEK